MVALRLLGALLVLTALTSCGGGDSPPQLADGSTAPEMPAALDSLGDGVLTRTAIKRESELDGSEYEACGVAPDSGDRTVVERTGINGSSLTIGSGRLVYVCDKIPDLLIVEDDPDMPYGNVWCASANGRIDEGGLNDPRLSLCSNTDEDITGFAWVEPQPGTKWIVVRDAGRREVYEVAESVPVRVTTTEGVELESSRASFAVEEYAADGSKLRGYVLETAVAG